MITPHFSTASERLFPCYASHPVPVPVQFGRRDCMDDTGCQEIMSGESVAIDALHKEGKTNIYRMGGPKYIPGLI